MEAASSYETLLPTYGAVTVNTALSLKPEVLTRFRCVKGKEYFGIYCEFLGAFAKFRKAANSFVCLSYRLSVRMEQFGSHWMDFHEIRHVFEKFPRKFSFHYNLTNEDLCIFMNNISSNLLCF